MDIMQAYVNHLDKQSKDFNPQILSRLVNTDRRYKKVFVIFNDGKYFMGFGSWSTQADEAIEYRHRHNAEDQLSRLS